MSAPTVADQGASEQAIRHHYDVGDEFYELFLDPTFTYSCAMFRDGDDLETAQRRKVAWHIENSGAIGARRVLDVGCGWGTVLRSLVEDHGVASAVGLTLSDTQHAHVRATTDERVEVRLENWRDHRPEEKYDAIISVGAFEHFARYGATHEEKIGAYRAYFDWCRSVLEPGRQMTLQTIAYGDIPRDAVYRDEFIAKEIFPESDLPRLADIAEASEGRFEIRLVRNDRHDYERTCRLWFRALRENREEAIQLVGTAMYERYERYLRTFSYSFGLGAFSLLRIVLARIDHKRH